jgi:putative transposon-encoded protein
MEKYIRISMDILYMRRIEVRDGNLTIKEKVEMVYEKRITPFGNSAKLDAPRKYRGWRAYVVIVGEK